MRPFADIIASIQAVLQTRGWTQGTYRNTKGEVCLFGALVYGTTTLQEQAQVANALNHVLVTELHYDSAMAYNDMPGRTVEDIQHILDLLAAYYTPQPSPLNPSDWQVQHALSIRYAVSALERQHDAIRVTMFTTPEPTPVTGTEDAIFDALFNNDLPVPVEPTPIAPQHTQELVGV